MEIRDYEYIVVPNILKDYRCSSSGECCKSKWKIDIDSTAYEKTKEKLQEVGENIEEYIATTDENKEHVTRFANGYCKLITENKLCRVHKEFGWECLSDTCKVYPRILKLTPRGLEMSLVFSCSSSAKLLLKEEEFEVLKVKKEDLFIMNPSNVGFIIPENNIPTSAEYRYFELEEFMIKVLKEKGNLGKKVQYIYEKLDDFHSLDDKSEYDFEEDYKNFRKYRHIKYQQEGLNDYLIKTILTKGERSKGIATEFVNKLKIIRLSNDLKLDKEHLREESFVLNLEDVISMKSLWTERDEKVLQNYILCFIFNKDFYYTKQYAFMKMLLLAGLLKFRILLNKRYLKRELTDDELIFTIKSHDNDFSHDGEFFNTFYNNREDLDIENYLKKMITMLY